jgi:hypothetical protein
MNPGHGQYALAQAIICTRRLCAPELTDACARAGARIRLAKGPYVAAAELLLAESAVVVVDRVSVHEDLGALTALAQRLGARLIEVAPDPAAGQIGAEALESALAEALNSPPSSPPLQPALPEMTPAATSEPDLTESILTEQELRALLEPNP